MEDVDPEIVVEAREFNRGLMALVDQLPSVTSLPVEVTRKLRREGDAVFPKPTFLPTARNHAISLAGRDIDIRFLLPADPMGVYIHFHGGGFVLGRADERDLYLWELAEATGLCVASVDYRLAPEHPFPAAHEDALEATLWLLEHAPADLNVPARFAIGGESAGGTLAVATLQALRDRHNAARAFSAANLICGLYDFSGTPSSRLLRTGVMLSQELLTWFREHYMPGVSLETCRDPDRSPLFADAASLPPALFTVGTKDPLLDDSLFMYARWRAAGNVSELCVYPEGGHVFPVYPMRLADVAKRAVYDFLRTHLTEAK